ncbi:peptidyl-prolyl cis-trans isomerase [uncultured Eudoraea sp.]|uniref:peptidyl-prolyl cis-trans isomerase n=1 Tax=uncultured Eudoraea sp. TaxID=1035614 RepID=UPI00261066EF|nr:peptidyl-prolyl cis-trans isomerase [uncultured Eudoraea sp.]
MRFLNLETRKIRLSIGSAALVTLLFSCNSFLKSDANEDPLARVGDTYLYWDEVAVDLGNTITKTDSASKVSNYINNWATKQILLEKAKINLPDEKISEFEQLVSNYRKDLYTRAYKEALVNQVQDTVITEEDLRRFYEEEKENFKLKEKIIKLRFIQLPLQFLNTKEVTESLRRFNQEDIRYLDSIGVQFKKLNFNDSLWVPVSRVIEEIPPLNSDNEDRYLKKSQFFELEDAMGVYLTKINDVLEVNEIAPLSYVEPRIRQVLLNRRKLDYIRKLETDIIDEATKEKVFEVYEK